MKKTAEEILSEITGIPIYRLKADDNGEYILKSSTLKAMDEYASQFKVEPGLSLQQFKDEVAKNIKQGSCDEAHENWESFMADTHYDSYFKVRKMDDAVKLHTASLTSEIKGLREAVEPLIEWNIKYPPGRIYGYDKAIGIERELTEAINNIKNALNTKNN